MKTNNFLKRAIGSFILLTIGIVNMGCSGKSEATIEISTITDTTTPTISSTATDFPTQTPFVVTATQVPSSGPQELFILSLVENGYAHLFAFSPSGFPLTRLTDGQWDDVTPCLSPDGTRIAFSSRRNGYWDLYILDLQSGVTSRVTDTLDYESSPSWSPDGLWLVFETYRNLSLDLDIIPINSPQDRMPLKNSNAAEHSPAWSPNGGRQIAFISDQTGNDEVWLADLDKLEQDRFSNISNNSKTSESHPSWSPDGGAIAWSSSATDSSLDGIYLKNIDSNQAPHWLGGGNWPVWNSAGNVIFAHLPDPNGSFLTSINIGNLISFPPILLPGELKGLDFGVINFSEPFPQPLLQAAVETPTPHFQVVTTTRPVEQGNRLHLVTLPDVQAPYPQLLDELDDSFNALRQRIASDLGWDALASLENAFKPISIPPDPGLGQDWLYTGRAFSLNPILLEAGWMNIVAEKIGQQVYWRVYLRSRAQDGSQGEPLHQKPWDIYSRFTGTPAAYEQGGQQVPAIPSGFWVDFSSLASAYGWLRLPALPNWQNYIKGSRFGEFVFTSNLDWQTAMLQVYPPEVFITPTQVLPPTKTPTRTPWRYRTPTPTFTLTPRPTYTP